MQESGKLSIRARQFIALREEVLGPRGGDAYEINETPKSDYVTGVLEPYGLRQSMSEGLGRRDLSVPAPVDGAEEDSDEDISDFDISTKILDPGALPKSMGISFILESGKTRLDFCSLFARYFKKDDKRRRQPFIFIKKGVDGSSDGAWDAQEGDVKIRLISRKMDDGNFHVSMFLVNMADVRGFPKKSDYVFQPQLRINIVDGGALRPVRSFKPQNDGEEKRLDFLYRDYRALAKGHMTGAVWAKIDPERSEAGSGRQSEASPLLPPDMSEQVFKERRYSREDMEYFAHPHLRTDFLPSYSINNDVVDHSCIDGLGRDDMDAEILADGFSSPEFFDPLDRLAEAYKDWIDRQDISGLAEEDREIAEENLDGCRDAYRRIRSGIELLRDDNARLAFCFLNKAMAIQARWAGRERLVWRPFQLAFILQCLEGIARPDSTDREICDLLWYPTGGGKTEAYLGILIFGMALRRLDRNAGDSACYGTAAISRYTLRLLTLQQFRRALSAVTACELLRNRDWNPSEAVIPGEPLWGTASFSVGLWVGGSLTPGEVADRPHLGYNEGSKKHIRYVGAASVLIYNHGPSSAREETSYNGEEPAQVLKCPCCGSNLSIPKSGILGDQHEVFLTIHCKGIPEIPPGDLSYGDITEVKHETSSLPGEDYHVLKLSFKARLAGGAEDKINTWWKECIRKRIPNSRLECTAASRPGYFLKRRASADDPFNGSPYDIEIRCPNPGCDLNGEEWTEFVHTPDKKRVYAEVLEPFRTRDAGVSKGIPIPALCVDSQIYSRCPSLLVATVDKFAQLPMVAKTASIFGNIDAVDERMGFYRNNALPDPEKAPRTSLPMAPFLPPGIVIQDELHLIDGPLGSMVGLYETAVDALSTRHDDGQSASPKYLVSTATIRAAGDQIQSLYCKPFKEFPPPGITAGRNFFSDYEEAHPLDDDGPGRWYVGVMAPGRSPLTSVTRIWASILQGSQAIRGGGDITGDLEYFWTVVGYFNAMRELAGVVSAYKQDIPEYIGVIASRRGEQPRDIAQRELVELHSNIPDKSNISAILERLEKERIDAVLATSMFGTGVDVDKISQMVVNGQPKTTASYIQATGRVGRKKGALVVTFLRSNRPRDLDHYEFFTGYHRALHRHVEPLTVFPFSPGAVGKGLLPVMVAVLRNGRKIGGVPIPDGWAHDDYYDTKTSGCRRMKNHRQDAEISGIIDRINARNASQPEDRTLLDGGAAEMLKSLVSRWEIMAKNRNDLYYHERAYGRKPRHHVVLGDEKHTAAGFSTVNENTPNSLREVESNMRFRA